MREKSGGEAKAKVVLWLPKAYINVAAAIFIGAGLVMIFAASDNGGLLSQPDDLFGLTNRTILMVTGFLHLALGGCFLAARDLIIQGIIALWAGWAYIVYRVAMAWMKVAVPFPAVELMGGQIGMKPKVLDGCWKVLTAYLVIGGLLRLFLEWRRSRQFETEAFQRRWREMRERHS